MKQPNETSSVSNIMIRLSNENCHSVEIIETLMNNKIVCVTKTYASSYIKGVLGFGSQPKPITGSDYEDEPDKRPLNMFPALLDTVTELPTSTLKETTQNSLEEMNLSNMEETEDKDPSLVTESFSWVYSCEFCNITRDSDNIDPESVQSLNVKMQLFPCPAHIYVNLKDGKDFCFYSKEREFMEILEKLENPPPNDDNSNHTQKNITDGCRCQDNKKMVKSDESVKSTMIWLMNERCSSTEYIETLENGTEVCVTAPSISLYLGVYSVISSDVESQRQSGRAMVVEPIHDVDIAKAVIKEASSNVNSGVDFCMECIDHNRGTIDPKDVESVQMKMQSSNCPVPFILDVNLKNKTALCVNSVWQPWFSEVLTLTLSVMHDDT
ncbi:hypothetical protein PAMP_015481 [Pampus punctatissimus]